MSAMLKLGSGAAVLAAALCGLLLASLPAGAEEATFRVELSGPAASGDPDGRGEATVTLNAAENRVDVRLSYSNIAAPTAMHIRMGAAGPAGNIVLPIVIERDEGGTLVGRRLSAKPDVAARILASPGDYYLVVINDEYAVGALRGRLRE
jgi:hypothetical protein